MNKGNLSLVINLILFSFLAVLIVVGSDIILANNMIQVNQLLTNPTDIIGKIDNKFLDYRYEDLKFKNILEIYKSFNFTIS